MKHRSGLSLRCFYLRPPGPKSVAPREATAWLLGCVAHGGERIVIGDRCRPLFGLLEGPLCARRIVFDLVALDLADTEIVAFRMAEIKAGYGCAGPHRKAFGEAHADLPLAVEEGKQRRLLGVIGLCGIAGRGADAAIFFRDQLRAAELLIGRVCPELAAYTLMQIFRQGFGQPVGKRLGHDRGIVVIGALEAIDYTFLADP